MVNLTELLTLSVASNASDLHLSSELPPMLRVNGQISKVDLPVLNAAEVKQLVYQVMNIAARQVFEQSMEVDFAFEIPNLSRFRANIFTQARGVGAVFRIIPAHIPTLDNLNCPPIFREIAAYHQGLVLVTGQTGCGKSTTLAAILDYINETRYQHILTIEDPVEFVHASKCSLINQRELKTHTLSFANALKSALREDPDCVLIGELRDLETIKLAITAAETGHLVFGSMHTSSAAKTIDRIIDVFPATEKEMVRVMVAESLRAVISQSLIKRKNNLARMAIYEIMIVNSAIRNLIRENKISQIHSILQTGQRYGMQTLDQALLRAVKAGEISAETAAGYTSQKDLFNG